MEDPLALANLLADAALDGWQDVADRPDRNEIVGQGADGSPTSRADAVVEARMLEVADGLGLSVLSEECGMRDRGSELIAVIDPVDGTRNAGRGIPFFCTSVAIGRAAEDGLGSLEAGVVQNLVTADVYAAKAGGGATLNGAKLQRVPFDPDDVIVGIIADYATSEIPAYQARAGHHLRDLGAAALELCLVGTGAMDAFIVRQPWLRVVDVAAGVLFVREAGGLVIDPATNGPLRMAFDLVGRTGVLAAHAPDALGAVR